MKRLTSLFLQLTTNYQNQTVLPTGSNFFFTEVFHITWIYNIEKKLTLSQCFSNPKWKIFP